MPKRGHPRRRKDSHSRKTKGGEIRKTAYLQSREAILRYRKEGTEEALRFLELEATKYLRRWPSGGVTDETRQEIASEVVRGNLPLINARNVSVVNVWAELLRHLDRLYKAAQRHLLRFVGMGDVLERRAGSNYDIQPGDIRAIVRVLKPFMRKALKLLSNPHRAILTQEHELQIDNPGNPIPEPWFTSEEDYELALIDAHAQFQDNLERLVDDALCQYDDPVLRNALAKMRENHLLETSRIASRAGH